MSLYSFLAMVCFFLVGLTIVFFVEKRMPWPYGDLQPQPHYPDTTGYGSEWVNGALRSGFRLLGWTRDLKGNTYRVTYAMLVSPDRSTFAVIGVGGIASIPLRSTWLHTPSADGRSFYSTDNQNGVQLDLSRNWTNQLARVEGFEELWQCHNAWLQEKRVIPRGFQSGSEMEEFRALRQEHFRFMERAGLIRYTDPSGSHFRFTLLGAAKTASCSYFLGLARALTAGKFPRSV